MRWCARAWALALCAPLVLVAPGEARAADSGAQATARARGEEGLRLFQDGRWDAAYAAFAEADALYHAPTLILYMANCRRSQGRLVEARALYRRVVAEPVPPLAPEAFKKAQATALHEADALTARIAVLKVSVTGGGAAPTRFTVDGAPANATDLAAGLPLDPGPHVVAGTVDGAAGQVAVTLAEGEVARADIVLVPAARTRGSIVPAAVAFGAGGVGVVAGAVAGGLALGKIKAAHAGCTDIAGTWVCPAAVQPADGSAASAARTLTTVEAVGFAVGGAGVVAGVVLAILRPGGGKGAEGAGAAALRFDVQARREGAWAGVEGRF